MYNWLPYIKGEGGEICLYLSQSDLQSGGGRNNFLGEVNDLPKNIMMI